MFRFNQKGHPNSCNDLGAENVPDCVDAAENTGNLKRFQLASFQRNNSLKFLPNPGSQFDSEIARKSQNDSGSTKGNSGSQLSHNSTTTHPETRIDLSRRFGNFTPKAKEQTPNFSSIDATNYYGNFYNQNPAQISQEYGYPHLAQKKWREEPKTSEGAYKESSDLRTLLHASISGKPITMPIDQFKRIEQNSEGFNAKKPILVNGRSHSNTSDRLGSVTYDNYIRNQHRNTYNLHDAVSDNIASQKKVSFCPNMVTYVFNPNSPAC